MNCVYRSLLISHAPDLTLYIMHVNASNSSQRSDEGAELVPKHPKDCAYLTIFCNKRKGLIFPFPAKALVLPQPVKA